MTDKEETHSEGEVESEQPQSLKVGIRMQQGEHTGQPIYSNITTVQGGQGVVFVDFGFLDPKDMKELARLNQSGEKVLETIGARMSSRLAISVDAAANLSRQLNQLLQPKVAKAQDVEQGVKGGDAILQ